MTRNGMRLAIAGSLLLVTILFAPVAWYAFGTRGYFYDGSS